MILISAHITNYKSIEDGRAIKIDPSTTVFVGQNESGKTAFLEALHKSNSVSDEIEFDYIEDYPRKDLSRYEPRHETDAAIVAKLRYELTGEEVDAINRDLGHKLLRELTWTTTHRINNATTIGLSVPEPNFVSHLVSDSGLQGDLLAAAKKCKDLRALIALLTDADLNESESEFLQAVTKRFPEPKSAGWSRLRHYIYSKHLKPRTPRFLYFDQYKLLPAKVNLQQLQQRINSGRMTDEDRTVLGLLRLASIDLDKLLEEGGHERATARLEGISNSISDQVFEYWTQNQREGVQELEVKFDIKSDPADLAPFNTGKNLYVRIRSLRHRVSVPFDQRSKGFIWFFSFLVWFDSIKQQVGGDTDLVLLLDEPGLSLHALAQEDLLRYVDRLAKEHQVLYTTHSPFMVRSERLHQVRLVEDRLKGGTIVTDDLAESDEKTLFPLQAALGYSIAQNLFIAKKNLLVEGPADLVYLQHLSEILKAEGHNGLADDVVIVPVGGLDKLATFVALLGANGLELVVLHDWAASPDQRLKDLVRRKVIGQSHVLNYGMFRRGTKEAASRATDVEDLFNDALYVELFNKAYSRELATPLTASSLEPGDRIVERIERTLAKTGVKVRPSGGFNHYRPAAHLAAHPPGKSKFGDAVKKRFQAMFDEVNRLLSG